MRDASTQVGYNDAVVEPTLEILLSTLRSRSTGAPWLVGLAGLQGSGKSTLARQLAALANARGVVTQILSLDDFYLGRRERTGLAREVHPLLATRGVPGTHDIDLLTCTLRDLGVASARKPAKIPRFDKGFDTRLPPSRWWHVARPPHLILLEGWCVGVPAQREEALARPVNSLEREEDRDGRWRRWVNTQLADTYARLWRRLDALVLIEAPGFSVVARWRDEQERAQRKRHAPHALDATALARFLLHYERLSRHALRVLPARADLRLLLRADRRVRNVMRQTPAD